MSVVLGLDAVLYRGAAGARGATEVISVKDLTLNLENGEADVTTRATEGWKASIATLKEGSIEFGMVFDTADADFQAFQSAYFSNTPMALFVSDGAQLCPQGGIVLLVEHPHGALRIRMAWARGLTPTSASPASASRRTSRRR